MCTSCAQVYTSVHGRCLTGARQAARNLRESCNVVMPSVLQTVACASCGSLLCKGLDWMLPREAKAALPAGEELLPGTARSV